MPIATTFFFETEHHGDAIHVRSIHCDSVARVFHCSRRTSAILEPTGQIPWTKIGCSDILVGYEFFVTVLLHKLNRPGTRYIMISSKMANTSSR